MGDDLNETHSETPPEKKKEIKIKGNGNRYQIKKLINDRCESKPSVINEKWNLDEEYYTSEKQLELLSIIKKELANESIQIDEQQKSVLKIIKQQINSKISGYKRQDIKRNLLDSALFITFSDVLDKLINSNIECYYCKKSMKILYRKSRDHIQWTIDRIDNDKGHNKDNYYLACLKCNLDRRRINDSKFLFTKQMTIVKQNDDEL
jgi:hypothetical protein